MSVSTDFEQLVDFQLRTRTIDGQIDEASRQYRMDLTKRLNI